MTSIAQVSTKGFPKAVVAEPAVAHNEEVVLGKGVSDLGDHFNSLLEFGLEFHKVFPDLDRSGFEVLSEVIEASGQRKTGPSFLNELEEAEANDILRPGVLTLVLLSSVVEKVVTAIDQFTGLGVDEVIESEDQTFAGLGAGDELPGSFPNSSPGKFGRTQKTIELAFGYTNSEQMMKTSQDVGSPR